MRRVLGIVLGAVPLLLTACLLTACGPVPARPSADAWRSDARTAVDEVVAQVGTAALLLEQDQKGHLLGGYGVVTVVHAEEALGTAADTILSQQVPPGLESQAAELDELFGKAESALRDARSALVRGSRGDVRELERLHRDLERLGGRL